MLNFLVVEHEDQSNSMLDLDFLKVDTQNRKLVVTDPLVLKRTESISVVIEVESNNKEDRKHDSESSEEFSNYWVFKNQSTIPKTFHLDWLFESLCQLLQNDQNFKIYKHDKPTLITVTGKTYREADVVEVKKIMKGNPTNVNFKFENEQAKGTFWDGEKLNSLVEIINSTLGELPTNWHYNFEDNVSSDAQSITFETWWEAGALQIFEWVELNYSNWLEIEKGTCLNKF